MKLLVIVVFVGTIIAVCANGGNILRGNAKNSEYPDKCWHNETKHAFGFNEEYLPIDGKSCQKIVCQEEYVLRFESCPPTGVKTECLVTDYTKSYPDCCPKVKQNC